MAVVPFLYRRLLLRGSFLEFLRSSFAARVEPANQLKPHCRSTGFAALLPIPQPLFALPIPAAERSRLLEATAGSDASPGFKNLLNRQARLDTLGTWKKSLG
jgi:hypothetical protein